MPSKKFTAKRKPYQKPTLCEYGDIRSLTQTNPSGKGAIDNPQKGWKTS